MTLGSGNKSGLFYVLSSDYAPQVAANAMNRLAKLSARFIGTHGFSIGINDVTPDENLITEKMNKVNEGYTDCEILISQYKSGQLQLLPGCTAEQTLENRILGVLSGVREHVGKECLGHLPRHNSPLIMALCGSKGSTINISQMIACVGQQAVGGSRIHDGTCQPRLSLRLRRSDLPFHVCRVPGTHVAPLPPRRAHPGRQGVCGELLLLWPVRHRVLLPHHGRPRGPGGHRRQDGRDWVHVAPAHEGARGPVHPGVWGARTLMTHAWLLTRVHVRSTTTPCATPRGASSSWCTATTAWTR